jgi:ERCC4-related helicase
MNGLEFILSQPDLTDALVSGRWRGYFDGRSLSRASGYTSKARLLSFEIVVIDRDDFSLEGTVAGNSFRRYETFVHFEREEPDDWLLDTDCSCPVGFRCKHAAALLLRLSHLLANPEADEPAPSGLDHALQNWLRDIEQSQSIKGSDPPKSPPKPDNRFLAYCIETPHSALPAPVLRLRIGRRLKSGEIRIETRSHAKADPLNPPKYLKNEDLAPCALFRQREQNQYVYGYDSRPLEGSSGHTLLQEVLKTERLFSQIGDGEAVPVRSAAALRVALGWEPRSDGSAAPTLGLPPDSLLIPTSPLLVLCPPTGDAHGTLHPVEADSIPESLLAAWGKGPAVPVGQITEIAKRFTALPEPLPAPVEVKTKTLPKSKPIPHLTLHRKNPFAHAGLHMSGQPEPIVASLEFDYHGHALTPDLDGYDRGLAPLSVFKDDTILTIPRHKSAEFACIKVLLTGLGLVPVSHFDPVGPDGAGCFLPDSEPKAWDHAWARLTGSLPELEEQGWKVTIDTSARIEVHAIGPDSLDTGLTELPEHGIDWFQFEASYLTPEGNKQSLLPLLSAYLEVIDPATLAESLETVSEDDDTILKDPDTDRFVSINTKRLLNLVKSIHELFGLRSTDEPIHRLQAADLADSLELDSSETLRALANLGRSLKDVTSLPKPRIPKALTATLRDYQIEGFHWMQFLARHGLHAILADDMGLGKTLQALTHLQAEVSGRRTGKRPSLVIAPTSVIGNWANEARKFAPKLKVLVLHGPDRKDRFHLIAKHHLVLTSYALLARDFEHLKEHDFHLLILDEAQYIKNPAAKVSQFACQLSAAHRLSLSGTPLENHLGELWSQMRFLMPGLLGSSKGFRRTFRSPIEKDHNSEAQAALNRRVAPLILRRTKDEVATELPPKTEITHVIPLHQKQIDLYETVRAAMDKRIRDIVAEKGLSKSHIIVLDALLKLRQICCHPKLLKLPAARKVQDSAKLDFLTTDLLPTLLEEGRKILLFSTFTSMLALIEEHLEKHKIPFAKITGSTTKRQEQIDRFQNGEVPVFLISLKAGGTGLNLTAADTVIHYDPWWNPAAENQATDRAHRIGQDKPVFVHKLICEGTIEQRIQELQAKKAALVEALLTADTNRLKIDPSTLSNLLTPLEPG